MKPNNFTTLIIATLVIAGAAYWYFFVGTGNEAALTPTTAQNAVQTQFATLVSELQPITFNTTIFSDPRFMSLVDLTIPITPEAAGRSDPFAPIQGVTGQ